MAEYVVSSIIVFLLSSMSFTQAALNCSEPAVPGDFDASICCRLPKINLDETRAKCRTYVESLQLPFDNAYAAYAHMCFSECMYRDTGALVNGEIVLDNVKSFLEKNVDANDAAIIPHIVHSFESCLTSIRSHMQNVGININDQLPGGCSPLPGLVYSCVDAETFLHCPADMWKQDEPKCEAIKIYGEQCNPLPHVALPVPVNNNAQ